MREEAQAAAALQQQLKEKDELILRLQAELVRPDTAHILFLTRVLISYARPPPLPKLCIDATGIYVYPLSQPEEGTQTRVKLMSA